MCKVYNDNINPHKIVHLQATTNAHGLISCKCAGSLAAMVGINLCLLLALTAIVNGAPGQLTSSLMYVCQFQFTVGSSTKG